MNERDVRRSSHGVRGPAFLLLPFLVPVAHVSAAVRGCQDGEIFFVPGGAWDWSPRKPRGPHVFVASQSPLKCVSLFLIFSPYLFQQNIRVGGFLLTWSFLLSKGTE